MFTMIPLLALSVVLFTALNLLSSGAWYDETMIPPIMLVSGDPWEITFGDAFLILSLVLLFIELLRATRTGTQSLLNHALSVVVFIACLLLFLIAPGYGNSVFFLLTLMTLLDFMAGFIVTTVTARRDFSVAQSGAGPL